MRISNEILMHFRSLKKSAGELHFDEPIETDKNGNQLALIDIISDGSSVCDSIELIMSSERLYKLVDKYLDERESQIIIMRYGLFNSRPLTQREVAQKLNISRSYVSRIEKKALQTLKSHMN